MRRLVLFIGLLAVSAVAAVSSGGNERMPAERPDDPPVPRAEQPDAEKAVADIEINGYRSIQVNVDGDGANIPGDAANEPSIAVDPRAPNRLFVGWRQFDSVLSNFREAGLGISLDGGRTWSFPGVLDDGIFRSDPVLATDRSGRVFYNSLAVPGGDIVTDYFLSDDVGGTWTAPIPAYGGDKAWTTVDTTGGIGDGHVYQSWANAGNIWGERVFTRSVDGGFTWSEPMTLAPAPTWGSMVVAPDGALYIAGNADYETSVVVVWRSMDAQDPVIDTPSFDLFITSFGGFQGTTVDPSQDPNPQGLLGQVWLDVDRSGGPSHGTLYMVCSVDPTGPDPQDVRFLRSEDNGETWSAPVTIHPDDDNRWQWFGTMSVAPNGRIDVVWIESTEPSPANVGRLMVSQSHDGGATWTPAVAASPEFDSHVGWPNQNKLGDYFHMRSDRVGADLIYAATFNGEQDVYYLRIGDRDCDRNGVGDIDDLASGHLTDCDRNDVPDLCDVAARPSIDANGDGTPDVCTMPREATGRAGG